MGHPVNMKAILPIPLHRKIAVPQQINQDLLLLCSSCLLLTRLLCLLDIKKEWYEASFSTGYNVGTSRRV